MGFPSPFRPLLSIIEQRIIQQHCGSITKLQLWKTQ
eukprot:gene6098-19751_t